MSSADIAVDIDEQRLLRVSVDLGERCQGLEPLRVVSRRAGQDVAADLVRTVACRFEGEMVLPTGGALVRLQRVHVSGGAAGGLVAG